MKIRNKSILIQSEGKNRISQWHFTLKKIAGVLSLILCLTGAIVFFTADTITEYFYKSKIEKIRSNYSHLNTTLTDLESQLNLLNEKVIELEEQETKLRMVTGLPVINNDFREVGIGGVRLNENFDIFLPGFEKSPDISNLERDVETLVRKVKLELSSFDDIHQKIINNREKLKYIPSIKPVEGGYLNSGYGYRRDPFDGARRFHHGQDFSVFSGTPIQSPASGTVKRTGYRGGYGKYIVLDHGYGYETKYLHLSKINVKKGQSITRGEIIGESGNSGRSTAPHLHYEVLYNGTPQNPLDYFYRG